MRPPSTATTPSATGGAVMGTTHFARYRTIILAGSGRGERRAMRAPRHSGGSRHGLESRGVLDLIGGSGRGTGAVPGVTTLAAAESGTIGLPSESVVNPNGECRSHSRSGSVPAM